MMISQEEFSKNIQNLNPSEDVFIYAEKSGGNPLATSMFGDGVRLLATLLTLVEKFADEQDADAEEVLKTMLEMCQTYHEMKDGRDY